MWIKKPTYWAEGLYELSLYDDSDYNNSSSLS